MTDVFDALKEIDSDAHLALSFIAHECIRQRRDEGWTPEHDDEHGKGEMAAAAATYAAVAAIAAEDGAKDTRGYGGTFKKLWPWDARWWKPKNPWRDLTRAGALIVAEMGRRVRKNCADYSEAVSPENDLQKETP